MRALLALILLLPIMGRAEGAREIIGGSLTYHIFNINGSDERYSNKLSNDGRLIDNALLGYRDVEIKGVSYTAITYFTGTNSVAEPIFGAAYSAGYAYDDYRVGIIAGAYMQDNNKFFERNLTPVMIIPSNGWAPSPVIGIETSKIVNISDKTYFLMNMIFTPTLINGTVGVGFKY